MTGRFLTARSGSFKRTARIVQPHIAARDHLARDVDIVILDKNEVSLELTELAEVNDMLNEPLPVIVARMCFPGKDKLNRPLPVMNQANDIFKLLKDERSALVCREAPRKPDRQCVGV